MTKYERLDRRVNKLEAKSIVELTSACGYGKYNIEIDEAVKMLFDHLGLAYELGVPSPSKLIKVPLQRR